jgi:hypothetical protein
MFTVLGSIDGVAYRVDVGESEAEHNGSTRALSRIALHRGELASVTPTGPSYAVDLDDPRSVLAALYAWTTVVSVSDGAPRVIPATDPRVVY